ncbi:MAG: transposase domain-containing protein [Sphaerochaetaceae bacterium]
MTDYISVKELARIIGKTPRALQLAKNRYTWRMKDKKSIEFLVASLPEDWQRVIEEAHRLTSDLPVKLSGNLQIRNLEQEGQADLSVFSVRTSERMKLASQIVAKAQRKPRGMSDSKWFAFVGDSFNVSAATVRRAVKSFRNNGEICSTKQERGGKWDSEAIAWLRGFYLDATHRYGKVTAQRAYEAVVEKAAEKGWAIGGRTSAYELINGINPLLVSYATGGNRALDNYFYISRDCDRLAPMQIVIGDQHIFDFWVADYDEGVMFRPQCYCWIDMCTKLVYGIAFDRVYNSGTVKEALRQGINRFGLFDCTYNDNGSSECSKAFTAIADDFIRLQLRNEDISELYRSGNGSYAVTDDETGEVVDIASSQADWRRKDSEFNEKHRRIYAQVKNAKAKDIERFFRTLETRLTNRLIPGACATPGASAAQDEVERRRLEQQKDRHQLLTLEEFELAVIDELDRYENRIHGTLKMTPREKIMQKWQLGWRPRWVARDISDFMLFDRCRRKVDRGRISIDGHEFIGEDIRATEGGDIADVGLYRFDGSTLEIRYDKHDYSFAYAITDRDIRPLMPVDAIAMLDNAAMDDAIAKKRCQMKVLREAFARFTKPIGSIEVRCKYSDAVRKAIEGKDRAIGRKVIEAAKQLAGNVEDNVKLMEQADVHRRVDEVEAPPLFMSDWERYAWCCDQMVMHLALDQISMDFMASYKETSEYRENEPYWAIYEKIGGGVA